MESLNNLSFEILRDTPFIIQEDPLVALIWSRLHSTPASKEPLEKYPSKLAFLRATAAWQLMQSQKKQVCCF